MYSYTERSALQTGYSGHALQSQSQEIEVSDSHSNQQDQITQIKSNHQNGRQMLNNSMIHEPTQQFNDQRQQILSGLSSRHQFLDHQLRKEDQIQLPQITNSHQINQQIYQNQFLAQNQLQFMNQNTLQDNSKTSASQKKSQTVNASQQAQNMFQRIDNSHQQYQFLGSISGNAGPAQQYYQNYMPIQIAPQYQLQNQSFNQVPIVNSQSLQFQNSGFNPSALNYQSFQPQNGMETYVPILIPLSVAQMLQSIFMFPNLMPKQDPTNPAKIPSEQNDIILNPFQQPKIDQLQPQQKNGNTLQQNFLNPYSNLNQCEQNQFQQIKISQENTKSCNSNQSQTVQNPNQINQKNVDQPPNQYSPLYNGSKQLDSEIILKPSKNTLFKICKIKYNPQSEKGMLQSNHKIQETDQIQKHFPQKQVSKDNELELVHYRQKNKKSITSGSLLSDQLKITECDQNMSEEIVEDYQIFSKIGENQQLNDIPVYSIYKVKHLFNEQGDRLTNIPYFLREEYEKRKPEIIDRVRKRFGQSETVRIHLRSGYEIDMMMFEGRMHVPISRNFTQIKFFNQQTSRRQCVFSCDENDFQCKKIFRKWHNLFDHLRIHTAERPFQCPVIDCEYSFNQISNQKKHLDTHGKIDLQCKCCGKFFNKQVIINHHEHQYNGKISRVFGTNNDDQS